MQFPWFIAYAQISPLSAHADVSDRACGLKFGPILHLHTYFVSTSSEGSGEPVHLKADHHRSAGETPFEWRFAGGLMLARHSWLAGLSTKISRAVSYVFQSLGGDWWSSVRSRATTIGP